MTHVSRPGTHSASGRKVRVIAAERLTRASVARLVDDIADNGHQAATAELTRPDLADALVVTRSDLSIRLLSGEVFDSVSGVATGARLGPFPGRTGIDVWFDIYFPAQQLLVRIDGDTSPGYVLTNARLTVSRGVRRSIRLDPGTIWIRSDLVGAGFPAGSYVGINHTGGTIKLGQSATVTGPFVDVVSPFVPVIEVALTADAAAPVAGACTSAEATITLPATLTLAATASGWQVTGAGGVATTWGQSFSMTPSTAPEPWTFVPRLWCAAMPFTADPETFDPSPIDDGLIRFGGTGSITGGGLSLPVVTAADPAILGAAARAGEWLLSMTGLAAEWYDADARRHPLPIARVGISRRGAFVLAEGILPLVPALTNSYDLWAVGEHRLPWRNNYSGEFWLLYRCDVVEGESLIVESGAELVFDRPVTVDGAPLVTPITRGISYLRSFGGTTRILLAGLVGPSVRHQFALRNALVWTRSPVFVLIDGELVGARSVQNAAAQVPLPVVAWAPTLPDPYVSNANVSIRQAEGDPKAQTMMTARIRWTVPDEVSLSFDGSLGTRLAVSGSAPSPGESRPTHKHRESPVGLTQVEQHAAGLDRAGAAQVSKAKKVAAEELASRVGQAIEQNNESLAQLDGVLRETVGGPPSLLLLDVSTNQDLLGIGIAASGRATEIPGSDIEFTIDDVAAATVMSNLRVVALPQVQWEPVRTLDSDQDIVTLGWFPTPLASASDGGATHIGVRSQKLRPVIPDDALDGAVEAFRSGSPVGVRTTFPFGMVAAINVRPDDTPTRRGDIIDITRPSFPSEGSRGGIQFTAKAEGGRPDTGGVSPTFNGAMRQLLNGVDLASGSALSVSVLGSTGDPGGSVETIFNLDMASNPMVPVTRVDISGYGGSSFSDWNNPFAAFSEAAKVQFRYMVGRTAVEVIKVNTVLHPWGIRVTRSVTVERRPGGGVIRRDSGWQAFTPGLFDYRYFDKSANVFAVADYEFDAGVFQGLFAVRTIRPAPGAPFSSGASTLLPYYFDADVALENVPGRSRAIGVLGFLQTTPNGEPAPAAALRDLILQQGPIGGPIDVEMTVGGSGLPFRAQRIEVGLADDAGTPIFVAAVRGAPKLPTTGAWSVVRRPVSGVPVGGGEAVPVGADRGVPLIRRNEVRYVAGDLTAYDSPQIVGASGDHRLADAADLLTPNAPANDYALLQSTSCHALLFPRPVAPVGSTGRLLSGHRLAIADVIARSGSKGAFPPAPNTIELAPNAFSFDVGASGSLALSAPIDVVGHPTPLRIAGTTGHGSTLRYDSSTLHVELGHDRWAVDFTGLRMWSDIVGMSEVTGTELRIVGSTDQRPQIATMRSLLLDEIEQILSYIPLVGARGTQGPIDLGASNATHELKFEAGTVVKIPLVEISVSAADPELSLELSAKSKSGLDLATSGFATGAELGLVAEGRFPVLTVGVASVFIIVSLEVAFSIISVSGTVTEEELELTAFAGVGVEGQIGPFEAYAFLGIGFVLQYDAIAGQTKYGGLVALEAGVDLKIVSVTIRAELKGLVYDNMGTTTCDYAGSVEINVDIFLFFSISATYEVSETTTI